MYCETLAGGRSSRMTGHIPVLLEEVLAFFSRMHGGACLDLTFGGGGHTQAILEHLPDATVLAMDQDPVAARNAASLQENFSGRLRFEARNFADLENIQESGFTGVLMDLGVSSFQLDDVSRGFSFREDAPLDMRMNPQQGQTAAEFLEKGSLREIETALRDYGEEPRWRAIARAIIEARGKGLLQRTASLAALVEQHAPRTAPGRRRIHPATRTFQGIRIAVNRELECLQDTLPVAFKKLAPGGVLVVISFHSLEDRIVKRFFRKIAGLSQHKNDPQPQQERQILGNLLTKKPIVPSPDEIKQNPRSRSAKLRAICKGRDL